MRALAIRHYKARMEMIELPRPEPKFKLGDAIYVRLDNDRGEQLEELAAPVDQGAIKPVLDKTFPFEAAAKAISYVESGRAVGKVVIRVAE